ncbi:hypothetical protein [Geothrix sp. 21YS21S-2]|uniref:hypothetical protein n=1 Tax=Geothrix sp. 21YS21S-2 TaxID=3068893 RepID=UPI0027BA2BA7|nr:hypothetical protein [Geothrix sp. 21YS21S-2]
MPATLFAGGLYRGITRFRSASILSATLGLTLVAGGFAPCTLAAATVTPAVLTLSPVDATVASSGTIAYSGTVSSSVKQRITWYVDGITMGNTSVGTLALNGSHLKVLYKAPAAAGKHVVKMLATDRAGNRVSRSNYVTVQAVVAAPAPVPGVLSLNPAAATVAAGSSLAYTATVNSSMSQPITWFVDGVEMGNATLGTLVLNGSTLKVNYAAPAASGTHIVKAVGTDAGGNQVTGSSSVTVTASSPTPPPPTAGTVDPGPLAAFPGCEGMGGGATGGRGGAVYTVNTLEDTVHANVPAQNGPKGAVCSLRDAMTKTGPRTIVFSVGGTITLHSTMWPVPPGLTIAGQTAPGGGIQVRGDGTFGTGGALLWYSGNTIIRYLRIRPGNAPLNASQQGLTGLATNDDRSADVVLDHNSFEWDGNKAASYWSAQGVFRSTFSWNLVAECMAPHSTGLLVGGDTMGQANMDEASWDGHHNVLATIDHRLPQTWLKYGRWINNYVSGYGYAMLIRGGTQFDIIGNVWDGINTGLPANAAKNEVRWADTSAHNENQIVSSGTAQIYMSNNFGPKNPLGSYDNFSTMLRLASNENGQLNDAQVDTKYKASSPVIPSALNAWPITITPLTRKEDLKALLAPKVGANRRLAPDGSWVDNRDLADERIINYFLNPASSPTSLVTTAGPYPSLAAGTSPVDTDGDGMPDVWEDAHGLDKNDASDRNVKRPNARGYTNLELYLSGLYPNGTPLP